MSHGKSRWWARGAESRAGRLALTLTSLIKPSPEQHVLADSDCESGKAAPDAERQQFNNETILKVG